MQSECYAALALSRLFFFFNDTATTEIYTLSLHDALPICTAVVAQGPDGVAALAAPSRCAARVSDRDRSEEHTSELQSRQYLVCRLLLEKKKLQQRLLPHDLDSLDPLLLDRDALRRSQPDR